MQIYFFSNYAQFFFKNCVFNYRAYDIQQHLKHWLAKRQIRVNREKTLDVRYLDYLYTVSYQEP